ncbi:Wzz/FepE/Etk N-terminal domain-containing protein [Ferrimonas balearica]|uniref:Wzz/FepE/Etk N-terminal domain-containing protein n=1 Tax=Ferrimonas balearica TaxID=44012 RepID=UPI001C9640DC|nr:Wzz/FepE/Etk N-terminal domain-containing protein [Ferrimonas balearica]MBY5978943.1 LPS O-antigen length regulator [Ferrimonas balearica]
MSEHPSHYQRDAQFDERALRDDVIDLRELFSALWAGKIWIVAITLIFAVGSVVLALSLPNIYKSEALLAPASNEQGGGLSGLAGQFGGLASLAGINLGNGGGIDKTTMAIEVMKSREFLGQFVQQHDLMVPLMAGKEWNPNNNQLILDPDIYDAESETWLRQPTPLRTGEPTLLEAYRAFRGIFQVNQDKQTGLVTVSVEHYSPHIAKQWLDWLIAAINEEMKARDQKEAQRSIAFLETQLAQTRVAEMQTVLYQLIEEQTKTMMFAEVRDEYVFKTVDPAIVPEMKAEPSRALICVLGTMLGGMLAVFLVLVRHFVRK